MVIKVDPSVYARPLSVGATEVHPGETRDVEVHLGASASGRLDAIPVRVMRATEPGPHVFLTAAIHGDEVNGLGIIHALMDDRSLVLKRGSLVLVPVMNLISFEHRSRYLPDRRDLNRYFPGLKSGSLASRVAHRLFTNIVKICDLGIDLHSAAVHRTNFPSVRGDMAHPVIKHLAWMSGCELVVDAKGPVGSLVREATQAGCPTLVLEAGEALKIEPTVVECGVRYVRNILVSLGMLEGTPKEPVVQVKIHRSKWIRADHGGVVEFHVLPGDLVRQDQPLATLTDLMRTRKGILRAPGDGIVLGMSTLPCVSPGNPVCHLAFSKTPIQLVQEALDRLPERSLHSRLRADLATNIRLSPSPSLEQTT